MLLLRRIAVDTGWLRHSERWLLLGLISCLLLRLEAGLLISCLLRRQTVGVLQSTRRVRLIGLARRIGKG